MKKVKEFWKKAKFAIIISVFGGAGLVYVVKKVDLKPQAGVVIGGDTILNTGGDSIHSDTIKLDTTKGK